jgi:hypothetical protein
MFLAGAAFFSMWYFLSLYLQNVLGYGALKTGLAFLPMAVCILPGCSKSTAALVFNRPPLPERVIRSVPMPVRNGRAGNPPRASAPVVVSERFVDWLSLRLNPGRASRGLLRA